MHHQSMDHRSSSKASTLRVVFSACTIVVLMLIVAARSDVKAVDRPQASQRVAANAQAGATSARAEFFSRYCTSCHNGRARTAGLALDTVDPANVVVNAPVLEKVVQKLRAGQMPPVGQKRPDPAAADDFASWLESALDTAAARAPNPGRTESLHLLTRTEYHNAVRDLLALDVEVDTLLPADDSSYGFDNIAGVVKINQSRMERYLAAARKISQMAIGTSTPASVTLQVSPEASQDGHVEGLPFGTRGGLVIDHNFPQDGEYTIEVKLLCVTTMGGAEDCDGAGGFPNPHRLDVLLDGARAQSFSLAPRPRRERYSAVGIVNVDEEDERLIARIPIAAGPRRVGITFAKNAFEEVVQRGHRLRFEKPLNVNSGMVITQPYIHRVTITGPYSPKGPGDTPSRRAVFTCHPSDPPQELACATSILSSLARRAYRRPVSRAEVDELLAFYDRGHTEGGFERGIEQALRALLAAPGFLIRVERDPSGAAPGSTYRINDIELASRLSFFLWSSVPDDELLGAALDGRVRTPAGLARQVHRMLASPRADALTMNFAAQWLELRNLGAVKPNATLFPDFDDTLRDAMRRETELFFQSIVREDRSVVDLLVADYTFVNGRLARHYAIRGIEGSQFQRVVLDKRSGRGGLLGHASILTITSHANRNSPVKRGKWILGNILGTPPPPPPANVPPLPENEAQGQVLTVRERMAQHRRNPACASCHALIDPTGFALDNFDPVGSYRTVDRDTFAPIDASGVLPDGTAFDGLEAFKAQLVRRPERFVTNVVEKLLTYALGRGLDYYDKPSVRRIVRESAKENYRFSSVILGVVRSTPFQMRTAAGNTPSAVARAEQGR